MPIDIPAHNSPDEVFEAFLEKCEFFKGGSNRQVYTIPDHDRKVLKVSSTPGNFANWAEIVLFNYATVKEELAEIFSWSWSGKFLIMERLKPLASGDLLARGPDWRWFLKDKSKPENFGLDSAGKMKVLDYGSGYVENSVADNPFL